MLALTKLIAVWMIVLGQMPANPTTAPANEPRQAEQIKISTTPDGGLPHEASAGTAKINSVFDFVQRGGIMMIPIGLCSLIALTVIVERWASLRRKRIIPRGFEPGLRRILDQGLERRGEAVDYCNRDNSPVAHIFATAVKRLGEPVELLERHVQEAGEREVFKLRKYLRILAVIAAISPLMGLLGTLFGMIKAFQTVATSADALGKTEMLASGIYEALITTAAGLLVAIPALIGFHWLSARIEYLVAEMDRMTLTFIEEYVLPAGEFMTVRGGDVRTSRSAPRVTSHDNGKHAAEEIESEETASA